MNTFNEVDDERLIFVLTNEINQCGVKHDTVALLIAGNDAQRLALVESFRGGLERLSVLIGLIKTEQSKRGINDKSRNGMTESERLREARTSLLRIVGLMREVGLTCVDSEIESIITRRA